VHQNQACERRAVSRLVVPRSHYEWACRESLPGLGGIALSLNTQAGLALRSIRKRMNVTADELAKAMFIPSTSLRRFERGDAKVMVVHIELAANRLGQTPVGLLLALAREVESMAHAAQKVES